MSLKKRTPQQEMIMAAFASAVHKNSKIGVLTDTSGPFDLEKCPLCGLTYEFMDEPCLRNDCPTKH